MNNWYITLALFLFALSGLSFALWQHERRTGHRRILQAFEKEYMELGVDHGLAEAKALDLEQDLERMTRERDSLLGTMREREEKGHVDEDILAPPATQASTQVAPVRNARQRKGAARKEP